MSINKIILISALISGLTLKCAEASRSTHPLVPSSYTHVNVFGNYFNTEFPWNYSPQFHSSGESLSSILYRQGKLLIFSASLPNSGPHIIRHAATIFNTHSLRTGGIQFATISRSNTGQLEVQYIGNPESTENILRDLESCATLELHDPTRVEYVGALLKRMYPPLPQTSLTRHAGSKFTSPKKLTSPVTNSSEASSTSLAQVLSPTPITTKSPIPLPISASPVKESSALSTSSSAAPAVLLPASSPTLDVPVVVEVGNPPRPATPKALVASSTDAPAIAQLPAAASTTNHVPLPPADIRTSEPAGMVSSANESEAKSTTRPSFAQMASKRNESSAPSPAKATTSTLTSAQKEDKKSTATANGSQPSRRTTSHNSHHHPRDHQSHHHASPAHAKSNPASHAHAHAHAANAAAVAHLVKATPVPAPKNRSQSLFSLLENDDLEEEDLQEDVETQEEDDEITADTKDPHNTASQSPEKKKKRKNKGKKRGKKPEETFDLDALAKDAIAQQNTLFTKVSALVTCIKRKDATVKDQITEFEKNYRQYLVHFPADAAREAEYNENIVIIMATMSQLGIKHPSELVKYAAIDKQDRRTLQTFERTILADTRDRAQEKLSIQSDSWGNLVASLREIESRIDAGGSIDLKELSRTEQANIRSLLDTGSLATLTARDFTLLLNELEYDAPDLALVRKIRECIGRQFPTNTDLITDSEEVVAYCTLKDLEINFVRDSSLENYVQLARCNDTQAHTVDIAVGSLSSLLFLRTLGSGSIHTTHALLKSHTSRETPARAIFVACLTHAHTHFATLPVVSCVDVVRWCKITTMGNMIHSEEVNRSPEELCAVLAQQASRVPVIPLSSRDITSITGHWESVMALNLQTTQAIQTLEGHYALRILPIFSEQLRLQPDNHQLSYLTDLVTFCTPDLTLKRRKELFVSTVTKLQQDPSRSQKDKNITTLYLIQIMLERYGSHLSEDDHENLLRETLKRDKKKIWPVTDKVPDLTIVRLADARNEYVRFKKNPDKGIKTVFDNSPEFFFRPTQDSQRLFELASSARKDNNVNIQIAVLFYALEIMDYIDNGTLEATRKIAARNHLLVDLPSEEDGRKMVKRLVDSLSPHIRALGLLLNPSQCARYNISTSYIDAV